MDNYDTCSICCETYGKSLRPRILPCGHNYCTDCLQKMIKNGTVSCPTCLKPHHVSNASEITINFALEETLSKLAEIIFSQNSTNRSNHKVKKMQKLIAEQKSNAKEQQVLTANMRDELLHYDQFLCDFSKDLEESAKKLHALATRHESIAKDVEEERMKITKVLKQADDCDKELKDNLKSLEAEIPTKGNAPSALMKIVERVDQLEEWLDICQQQFPHHKFISVAKTDKLREMQWKQIAASGKVVAIDSRDGIQRFANLSLKEDNIYLHCLRKTDDLPDSTLRVKHSDLIESLNKEETLAFMDLRWDGSIQGRIHILLSPDTPLARNFRILCTGELGHTYANTEFSHTYGNRWINSIEGGNYERDRGGSGRAVIEGINFNDPVYNLQNETGLVFSKGSSNDDASQFVIITYSGTNNRLRGKVFGKLQDGIEIVQKAYDRLEANRTVEITDCGVVLPL